MKDKRIDQIVKEIQGNYLEAQSDYMMSSMLSCQGLGRVSMCEKLIDKINKIYNANYCLQKNPDYEILMNRPIK